MIWIAMLGVLFSALAPTLSHAMTAAAPADEAVQVCTMEGMKTIVLATTTSGKPAPADPIAKHCMYCATHCHMSSLPPAPPFVFALMDVPSFYPPLFFHSATPLFAWTAAAPRGPPGSA